MITTGALGAPNPNTNGQPSQSCQAEPTGPPGLTPRPPVESKRLRGTHKRREPLDPGVDQRLVDEAEGQAHVVAAPPVGEERRTRDDADASLDGSSREVTGIRTLRQRQP